MRKRTEIWRRQIGMTAVAVALSLVPEANAQTGSWINPAGGSYTTGSNWSGGVVPANSVFNLGSGSPYVVTLPAPITSGNLTVQNDSVTLAYQGVSTTNTATLDDLDILAGAGQTSSLTLTSSSSPWFLESLGQINVGGAGTTYLNCATGTLYVSSPSPFGEQSLFNFGSGSTVVIGTLMGGVSTSLDVGGNVSISSSSLKGFINVGGTGPNGAVLNGPIDGQDPSVTVGAGGVGTFNGTVADGQTFTIGSTSAGTANLQGYSALITTNIGTLFAPGVMNVGSGVTISAGQLTVGSQGTLNLATGGVVMAAGIVASPGATMNLAGGTLQLTNGTFNSASVSIAPALTLIGVGTFTGNLANSGEVEVGFLGRFSGKLVVDGAYTQTAGGLLEILIDPEGGVNNQFSLVNTPTFAGTLDIAASPTVAFTPGESFNLLSFPSETGSFSSLILPPLPGGLSWDTSQLYKTGSITVVPEPAMQSLLFGGSIAVLARRKLRRAAATYL